MTFQQWVFRVQQIAASRGLQLTTTYKTGPEGQQWADFNWRAPNGSRFGSAGAGAEFIALTTPEAFTWDWYGSNSPAPEVLRPRIVDPVPADPWERHGRYVPRVPAIAVSDALMALFKL